MPTYRCYYARHPAYGRGSQAAVSHYQRTGAWDVAWPEPYGVPSEPPQLFTTARLSETHALVRELDVESLGAVYAAMQVERLPRSELDRLTRIIADQGLPHTSMCAGDVIEDVQAGVFYECDLMGWREMQ
ncbi:MAG: hypothetical protein ACJ8CR_17655 [Roseiflexaceae bacterium]